MYVFSLLRRYSSKFRPEEWKNMDNLHWFEGFGREKPKTLYSTHYPEIRKSRIMNSHQEVFQVTLKGMINRRIDALLFSHLKVQTPSNLNLTSPEINGWNLKMLLLGTHPCRFSDYSLTMVGERSQQMIQTSQKFPASLAFTCYGRNSTELSRHHEPTQPTHPTLTLRL